MVGVITFLGNDLLEMHFLAAIACFSIINTDVGPEVKSRKIKINKLDRANLP